MGIFMTGTKQPLSADAIKEGVDNVCYQVSRAVTPESVSAIPTMIQDLHTQTLRNHVPTQTSFRSEVVSLLAGILIRLPAIYSLRL